jgi:hypothetical protein
LLMDKLYHRLQQDCPQIGVQLQDTTRLIINHIMYADDVVLLATSTADLQRLVNAMQVFFVEKWGCPSIRQKVLL